VTFDIDASGILTVTAKDKATGKSQAIKITGSTGLTKDEIEKMKEEAEKNAQQDQEVKDKIEARNKADNMIYVSEKSLKDAGDKAPKDIKEAVEKKIKDLKSVLEKGSKEDLENKTKDLSDELQKIGQYMYKDQKQPGQASSDQPSSKDNGKTEEGNKKEETKVEEGEVVK